MIDHMNAVARRKVNGPEGWEYFKWERVGEGADFIVEGAVPRLLKSGPRKGQKTWTGCPSQKTVVTGAEIDAEHARYEAATGNYEAATGNCGTCGGTGEVFASWRHDEGVTMKPCKRCDGEGKAPNDKAVRGNGPLNRRGNGRTK